MVGRIRTFVIFFPSTNSSTTLSTRVRSWFGSMMGVRFFFWGGGGGGRKKVLFLFSINNNNNFVCPSKEGVGVEKLFEKLLQQTNKNGDGYPTF